MIKKRIIILSYIFCIFSIVVGCSLNPTTITTAQSTTTSTITQTPTTSTTTKQGTTATSTTTTSKHVHDNNVMNFDVNNHWYECVCGEINNVEEHTFGEWIILFEATEHSVGNKKQICSICNYENIVEIPKLNHQHNLINGICSGCNYSQVIYELSLDGLSYEVKSVNSDEKNVVIAPEYNGKPVTKIKERAFYDCDTIVSVEIPNTITTIEKSAFAYCFNLENILIPNSVTSIGIDAFSNCGKLNYNIYDNAKYLGNENNPYMVLVGVVSRYEDKCEINTNTKIIYSHAFDNYYNLKTIEIPDSVIEIGFSAFSTCSQLRDVTIGNSLRNIGRYAFSDCPKLIYNTYDNAKYLGNENNPYMVLVEKASKDITSCEININTRFINSYAFYGCEKLTNLEIPNSVLSIGDFAFANCCNLEDVVLGDSITSIGMYSFYCNEKLTNIDFPNSLEYIGESAFEDCDSIISINIPNSVKIIDESAFRSCYKLQNVTLGDSIISIGQSAFYLSSNLKYVIMSNSIINIEKDVFYLCTNLEYVFYKGSQIEWDNLFVELNTDFPSSTKVSFYSETEPTNEGNYWHYVNDNPTIWN